MTAGRDDALLAELLEVLVAVETDMTLFYQALARLELDNGAPAGADALVQAFSDTWYLPDDVEPTYLEKLDAWLVSYCQRLADGGVADADRRATMANVNPVYVLRNYLAQLAIDAAEQGEDAPVRELLEVMRRPYTEQPGRDAYAEKRPDWARTRAGCSMLSCSS